MAKDATIGVRVDAELKEKAGQAFDEMGLPMSLGIELFLRNVADSGKLPFAIDGGDGAKSKEEAARERDFWRAFIVWYFDAWPRFDNEDVERAAKERYGFECEHPGSAIRRLIDAKEPPSDEERRAARADLGAMQSLSSEAKELIYWALDMDRVFVPSLSCMYALEADSWRLAHVRARLEDRTSLPARGVEGARYWGIDDDTEPPTTIGDLTDDELMDLFDEWVMESGLDGKTESLLVAASENATSFDDVRKLLIAAEALDDFEEYVEDGL